MRSKEIEMYMPSYLYDSKNLLVCVLDADGQILHGGELFKSFFSLPKFPLFTSFYSLTQDSQKSYFEDIMLEVMGSPYEIFSAVQYYPRGNVQWEFSLLKNNDGDFLGIMGIGTVRKESDSNILATTENIRPEKDIHFQLDQNWEIIHLNDAAEAFFGGNRHGLLNQKVWQVFPNSKIYEYALEFKKVKEDKRERIFEDFIPELGRWYQIHIDPRLEHLDIFFKDTSEVQLLENELSRLGYSLDAVLNGSEEAMILLSHDLRVLRFNPKAVEQIAIFLDKEIRVGDKFLQNLLPGIEQKILGQLESIISGHEICFEKEIGAIGNPNNRLFQHRIFPVRDNTGKLIGFVYANRDVHENRDLVVKLSKDYHNLREIAYQQFLELRSPLSSILGLLELLDKEQLDKENQKYLSYIRILADELDQIIRKNSQKINDSLH
ncbi:HTR-like protein [Mariniradius saccharolyticus AK6]|uniref:histidine kinase n=1 Tax=Mariniradius saccharolyticus AK6 TaxID=1239962 RepID=M7Y3F5_9BACT|nr:HTR-like protein [Mariniradius saccharolyticus AK6]